MPGWNEPVATGTRSPILRLAFWPSSARICGFCNSLVSLSLISADRFAAGMLTVKSVAFRFPNWLRLSWLEELEVGVVVVVVVPFVAVVVGVVVLMLFCRVTEALVGGLMP